MKVLKIYHYKYTKTEQICKPLSIIFEECCKLISSKQYNHKYFCNKLFRKVILFTVNHMKYSTCSPQIKIIKLLRFSRNIQALSQQSQKSIIAIIIILLFFSRVFFITQNHFLDHAFHEPSPFLYILMKNPVSVHYLISPQLKQN